jgi:hypothetical protein
MILMLTVNIPYDSTIAFLAALLPAKAPPSPPTFLIESLFRRFAYASPGLCVSFLWRLVVRGPLPLATTPFAPLVFGGCLRPGGRLIVEGDGDVWDGFVPFTPVCTNGGGGRFNFCAGGSGFAGAAVAICMGPGCVGEDAKVGRRFPQLLRGRL